MDLLSFLHQTFELPADIGAELDAAFTKETYPNHHLIWLPETLSKRVYFIESGLARTYYLKDEKDITHYFFAEDSFILPIESVFYNTPSHLGLELLEKSTIRSIQYHDLETLINKHNELEKVMRILLINVLKGFSDKMHATQFLSAQERYKTMLEKQPDILLRAPLGHIASYIGMTQQTLSVIRSQK